MKDSEQLKTTKALTASTAAFMDGQYEQAFDLLSTAYFLAVAARNSEQLQYVMRTARRRQHVLEVMRPGTDVERFIRYYEALADMASIYSRSFRPHMELLRDTSAEIRATYYASMA